MGIQQGLPELNFGADLSNLIKTLIEFIKNKTWISGILLGLLGWFPYIIAVSMIGIVLVQPLTSLGLVIYVICAIKILNEKINIIELIAVILLTFAPIFLALAKISEIYINLVKFQISFFLFLSIMLIISITCFILSRKKKQDNFLNGILITFSGAILYSLGTIFTNILTQAIIDAEINIISWFGWTEILFGIFFFDFYHFWVFFGFWGMISCYIIGLIFYQSGFQKVKSLYVYLIINSVALIAPIIAGLFIFNQIFSNYIFFVIGIILIIFSTIFLTKFQAEMEDVE
ncbi:MAG: hypothetical protein EU549_03205 [Promethearchaeota archaeon]|nr:MAG: hypothetical protein EU549_03205 [Candidatus Lokiarchaeota archaeon]